MVQDFAEKPSQEAIAGGRWRVAPSDGDGEGPFEASMGIYCFKRAALEALLTAGGAGAASPVHFGHVSPAPCALYPSAGSHGGGKRG